MGQNAAGQELSPQRPRGTAQRSSSEDSCLCRAWQRGGRRVPVSGANLGSGSSRHSGSP